ncbi:MAG: nicotinamide riboside transporter PnuC [Prevotellaceae bacterium]|jgi:nicotinamide mononucleotide transporter|nr:nicotinamide riboside transporter PnuC [Prevotellaceae bacterium]
MFSFFDVDTVFFTVGRQAVSYLEVLCTLAGLVCIFLAMRAKTTNFWIGYLYNILLFPLFLQKGLYASMLLQPAGFAITLFGHYRWTHPRKKEENRRHELKITRLGGRSWMATLLTVVVLTVGLGTLFSNLHRWIPAVRPAQQPFLDSFILVMILTAQWLSAQKKLDCWAAWMTVNVVNTIRYPFGGLIFLAIESGSKIIIASFGFLHWLKKYREDREASSEEGGAAGF